MLAALQRYGAPDLPALTVYPRPALALEILQDDGIGALQILASADDGLPARFERHEGRREHEQPHHRTQRRDEGKRYVQTRRSLGVDQDDHPEGDRDDAADAERPEA